MLAPKNDQNFKALILTDIQVALLRMMIAFVIFVDPMIVKAADRIELEGDSPSIQAPNPDASDSTPKAKQSPHQLRLLIVGDSHLNQWFGTSLINELAQRNPEAYIRMVGSCGAQPRHFYERSVAKCGLADTVYESNVTQLPIPQIDPLLPHEVRNAPIPNPTMDVLVEETSPNFVVFSFGSNLAANGVSDTENQFNQLYSISARGTNMPCAIIGIPDGNHLPSTDLKKINATSMSVAKGLGCVFVESLSRDADKFPSDAGNEKIHYTSPQGKILAAQWGRKASDIISKHIQNLKQTRSIQSVKPNPKSKFSDKKTRQTPRMKKQNTKL